MSHLNGNCSSHGDNFGISGISVYFPKTFVSQCELEKYDKVSSGKYTKGLGQDEMSFCSDQEDVVSISLTVTEKLMREYEISPASVGFLAVGTETLVDKSKSVKTELMRLFGENTDIEGVDVKNACFGGAQALLHAVDWLQSNYDTERRCAIAVMADIAIYEEGPARCTGGAAAIAVLLTVDAPLVLERGLRACHITSAWDFFKPIGSRVSEYPVVYGKNSMQSYMSSLDSCYRLYRQKAARIYGQEVSLSSFSGVFFHCPFTKLVRKALARLALHDVDSGRSSGDFAPDVIGRLRAELCSGADPSVVSSDALAASEDAWLSLTSPFLEMNRRLGNTYTSSLFIQLLNYLAKHRQPKENNPGRLLFFAYGSGSASAMFSLRVLRGSPELDRMATVAGEALKRLDERDELSPELYIRAISARENFLRAQVPASPSGTSEVFPLFPGTFHLLGVDAGYRREYSRFSTSS